MLGGPGYWPEMATAGVPLWEMAQSPQGNSPRAQGQSEQSHGEELIAVEDVTG